MFRFILLSILIFPAIELAILIKFGTWLGVLPTLAAIFATAIIGLYFIRLQGLGTLFVMRVKLEQGELPVLEIINGFLLAFAGLCLLIPGFVSDLIGFFLLVPGFRRMLINLLLEKPVIVSYIESHRPQHTHRPQQRRRGRTIDADEID